MVRASGTLNCRGWPFWPAMHKPHAFSLTEAGEQLPFLGQKMEWDEEKKELGAPVRVVIRAVMTACCYVFWPMLVT